MIVLAGSVISLVDVWIRVEVPAGSDVTNVTGYDVVTVAAGKIEVVVNWTIVVWVSLGNVTGYELSTVEAGWMDVSNRVIVSWAKVETIVLYIIEVPAGRDLVTEMICVKTSAGRIEVSVKTIVLAG